MSDQITQIALSIAIAVFVVVRQLSERRVRVRSIWLLPAIMVLLSAELVAADGLTTPSDVALLIAIMAAGAGIGWYQGTHTTVRVDRAAGSMFVKASPLGAIIWAVVIVFRMVVRLAAGGNSASPGGAFLTAALLALAIGVIAGQRAYLYRAYQTAPQPEPR